MGRSSCEPAGVNMSRSSSLDVMKCLAAFCVVWIHYGTNWLSPLVRCAVPLFFIITGYYYPSMVAKGKFVSHIKKLAVMVLCASMLHGLWTLQHEIRHDTLSLWVEQNIRLRHLIYLLVSDNDLFGFHLWYFYAVIYDLLLFRIIDKLHLTKYNKYITPLLLLVFLAGNYTPWYPKLRNFLFFGFPCMMIGRWIREGKDKAFSFLGNPNRMALFVSVSILMAYAEMFLLNHFYHGKGFREMFMFTLPMLLPFFYYALRHPYWGYGSIWATIGRKHSANIYIFHVLTASVLSHIVDFSDAYMRVMTPFLVFLVTLLVSYIITRIREKHKKRI